MTQVRRPANGYEQAIVYENHLLVLMALLARIEGKATVITKEEIDNIPLNALVTLKPLEGTTSGLIYLHTRDDDMVPGVIYITGEVPSGEETQATDKT